MWGYLLKVGSLQVLQKGKVEAFQKSVMEQVRGFSTCVCVWFWFIHLVLMSLTLVFEAREGLIEEREWKNGVLKSEWFRKRAEKEGQ